MTNTTLSDKGLVRGSIKITINGYVYLLKGGSHDKAIRSNFEDNENGRPGASSHVATWQKMTGEIMAYAGVPEPSQLVPFLYAGLYWTVGNLKLAYATEGLRSYSCEIAQLAGTVPADFVTSTV